MKNLYKTLLFTGILALISIFFSAIVQIKGQQSLVLNASYLDPIIIDVLAFLLAFFFIIEGGFRIFEHPSASLKRQFTRSLRVSFGFAILTIHVVQLFHKSIPVG